MSIRFRPGILGSEHLLSDENQQPSNDDRNHTSNYAQKAATARFCLLIIPLATAINQVLLFILGDFIRVLTDIRLSGHQILTPQQKFCIPILFPTGKGRGHRILVARLPRQIGRQNRLNQPVVGQLIPGVSPAQIAANQPGRAQHIHRGIAVIDIISPCVTFNNHDSSTKSYGYGKEHEIPLHELSYVPAIHDEIEIEEYEGEVEVELHDGAKIVLKKLDESHDPTSRGAAFDVIERAHQEGKFLTGLFYVSEKQPDMLEMLNLTGTPLARLPESKVRPSREALAKLMAGF